MDFKLPDSDTPFSVFDSSRPSTSLTPADAASLVNPLPSADTTPGFTPPGETTPASSAPHMQVPPTVSPDAVAHSVTLPTMTVSALPARHEGESPPEDPPVTPLAHSRLLHKGCVQLDAAKLRRLRDANMLSQQEMADDCWRRQIQIGLATIKRVELGRMVRYRIARELGRYYGVPATDLLK
ncbi:MAG: hypothetical protein HOP03_14440 [Lysobacter sp.]|nr:hypothetical protein [Lysobacter sp.]